MSACEADWLLIVLKPHPADMSPPGFMQAQGGGVSLPDMTLLGDEDAIAVGFDGAVDEYKLCCIAILELCDFTFGLAAPRTSARCRRWVGFLERLGFDRS